MRLPARHRCTAAVLALGVAAALPACATAPAAPAASSAPQAAPAQASAPASRPAKPIPDEEPAVTRQVADLLAQLARGQPETARFTDSAAQRLLPTAAQMLTPRMRECGIPVTLELLARTVDGEDRHYRYRVRCPGQPLLLDIVYNKAARVNQLQLRPE